MKVCRKIFLLMAGAVMTGFDELTSAIEEAQRSIEGQREKINQHFTKPETQKAQSK